MSPEHHDVTTDHEYDGIREHDNPLPAWWLWTFALTIVFALGYWFVKHQWPTAVGSYEAYGEAKAEYDRIAMSVSVDPQALKALADEPSAVAAGKATYDLRCQACHGPAGGGTVGPNLTDSFWLHGGDVKSIYMTIATGYPKLGMPEWRAVLEDRQIQELVAYLETLRNTNVAGKPPQGDEYRGEIQ